VSRHAARILLRRDTRIVAKCRWIRSGWRGGISGWRHRPRACEVQTRGRRSSRVSWISGYRLQELAIRALAFDAEGEGGVDLSGPRGRSVLSVSIASVIASLAKTSRAVECSTSPCSVR